MEKIRHLKGLDGIRALAILLILVYHYWPTGNGISKGGFIGVEVFFVISGFIITLALIREFTSSGKINTFRFWGRRVRRLWPALFFLMAMVIFAAIEIPKFTENWEIERIEKVPIFVPDLTDETEALKNQTLATVFSVANWYFIFQGKSYFDLTGRPPLFEHLWSLSIEWQFYLIWPLILCVILKIFQKKIKRVVICCIIFALSSFLSMLMWREFFSNESRAYFGTDARCYSLLIGATLVFFWNKKHEMDGWMIDFLGGLSLLIILFLGFNLSGTDVAVYRGGLLVCSLATGGLIISATNQKSKLIRGIFESDLLAWIGRRSYSLYLWHWPLFILTEPNYNYQIEGPELFLLRIVFLLGITEVSYQLIEKPFRAGGFEKEMQQIKETKGYRRGKNIFVFGFRSATLLVLVIFCSCSIISLNARSSALLAKSQIEECSEVIIKDNHSAIIETDLAPPSEEALLVVADNTSKPEKKKVEEKIVKIFPADSSAIIKKEKFSQRVVAIGDSVMLGAKSSLEQFFASINVDAVVSRQFTEVYQVVCQMKKAEKIPDFVFIHTGTNGTIEEKSFIEMMEMLKVCQRVIIFNLRVPRIWQDSNNKIIASIVPRYPNAVLVDWQKESSARKEIFYKDGIHLKTPNGSTFYAQLVRDALSMN